uniref:RRM domain-containing protein n=1 Tax=Panagrolaimus sp. PS1159 TaxID=55785 RepID=A0AC35FLV9_9BILA
MSQSSYENGCGTTSSSSSGDSITKCSQYSRKVFIGGLPFDATADDINSTFDHFGPMSIDWPRRHSSSDGSGSPGSSDRRQTSGYVFLIYRKESSVHRLLQNCKVDSGRFFMFMSTRNSCRKPVQVRPWRLSDFVYLPYPGTTLDPRNTVFIGGVPRPTRAVDIVDAFEKKYGKVIYASIDIDPELRYPKGAARIVFANRYDYLKAMAGRIITLPHCGTSKRIDIKPYVIDEQECSACNGERCNFRFASYFCAVPYCLQYYCEACWGQHINASRYCKSYQRYYGPKKIVIKELKC